MPYNNTPIPPRKEPVGAAQLPLSRVKKIIALDSDINMCSNNGAFVITLATEMFVQYMAEQGHNVVKSERKPRRNIQYRDLANAVSRLDNLEFLVDVVPKTVPFKALKGKKAPVGPPLPDEGSAAHGGQTVLDNVGVSRVLNGNGTGNANGVSGSDHGHEQRDDSEDPNAQLQLEIRDARAGGTAESAANGDATKDAEMS